MYILSQFLSLLLLLPPIPLVLLLHFCSLHHFARRSLLLFLQAAFVIYILHILAVFAAIALADAMFLPFGLSVVFAAVLSSPVWHRAEAGEHDKAVDGESVY